MLISIMKHMEVQKDRVPARTLSKKREITVIF
jgi:hypothetical protein